VEGGEEVTRELIYGKESGEGMGGDSGSAAPIEEWKLTTQEGTAWLKKGAGWGKISS